MTDEQNDLIQRLRELSRHEHDDLSIGAEAADAIRALIAERDAAFAMSGCECGADEACAQLVTLHAEVGHLHQQIAARDEQQYAELLDAVSRGLGLERARLDQHARVVEWAPFDPAIRDIRTFPPDRYRVVAERGEPVAWRSLQTSYVETSISEVERLSGHDWRPLYAAPPAQSAVPPAQQPHWRPKPVPPAAIDARRGGDGDE